MGGCCTVATQYEIRDGHLVTEVARRRVRRDRLQAGRQICRIRSREFGYANYEVEEIK